jgi:hypothetical protein
VRAAGDSRTFQFRANLPVMRGRFSFETHFEPVTGRSAPAVPRSDRPGR